MNLVISITTFEAVQAVIEKLRKDLRFAGREICFVRVEDLEEFPQYFIYADGINLGSVCLSGARAGVLDKFTSVGILGVMFWPNRLESGNWARALQYASGAVSKHNKEIIGVLGALPDSIVDKIAKYL
jgi:hypothetical protein